LSRSAPHSVLVRPLLDRLGSLTEMVALILSHINQRIRQIPAIVHLGRLFYI
jgi:hypothetical protein